MSSTYDVIVIGAGVSGLACAAQLLESKQRVLVLEATTRAGGRVMTCAPGVELGAEFLHGQTPLTDHWLSEVARSEMGDDHQYWQNGQKVDLQSAWGELGELFSQMKVRPTTDRSFAEFLSVSQAPPLVKDLARSYVEGFNAADANIISETHLARWSDSDDEMQEGSRLPGGYQQLVDRLVQKVESATIIFQSPVTQVHWQKGHVEVTALDRTYKSKKLICTVSVGVLQSGSLEFSPPIPSLPTLLKGIVMGHADRLTLEFRDSFWQSKTGQTAFLHLPEAKNYPVWWPSGPTLLTAWAGGPRAASLSKLSLEQRIACSLVDFAQSLGFDQQTVNAQFLRAYHHDWSHDPFTQGAYSYVAVGGSEIASDYIPDTDDTIFFAGEAACDGPHRGTVEGALMSAKAVCARLVKDPEKTKSL